MERKIIPRRAAGKKNPAPTGERRSECWPLPGHGLAQHAFLQPGAHFFFAQQAFLQPGAHFFFAQHALVQSGPQAWGACVAQELSANALAASIGMTDNWISFFIGLFSVVGGGVWKNGIHTHDASLARGFLFRDIFLRKK